MTGFVNMYRRKGQGNRFLLLGLLLVIVALFYVNINHIEELFSSKPTYPGEMFSVPPNQKMKLFSVDDYEIINIYSSDSVKVIKSRNDVFIDEFFISSGKFVYVEKEGAKDLVFENILHDTVYVGIEQKQNMKLLSDKRELTVYNEEPARFYSGVKTGESYQIITSSQKSFLFLDTEKDEYIEVESGRYFSKLYNGYNYLKKTSAGAETFFIIPADYKVERKGKKIGVLVWTLDEVSISTGFKVGTKFRVETASGKDYMMKTASYSWQVYKSGTSFTMVNKNNVIFKKISKEKEIFYFIP